MNIFDHKKTILIIIIVLLAFFGYWFLVLSKKDAQKNINQSNNQTNQNVKAKNVSSNTQYDKEFVSSLLGLNSVKLDTSIFQSKAYQALSYPEVPFVINYTKEIGRDNPFLPIGVELSGTTNVQGQNKGAENTPEGTATTTPAPVQSPTATTTPKPSVKKF